MEGKRFGLWTVVSRADNSRSGHPVWNCRCECGTEKTVLGLNLRQGKSLSCGCVQRTAGGLWGAYTKEYDVWRQMISRCHNDENPGYQNYGGRGIAVCDRWRESFPAFIEDMGPRPPGYLHLDRRDNNSGYHPANCHWTTPKVNANNTRFNRLLTHDGHTMTVSQWADYLGWNSRVIYRRLHTGWSIERTLTQKPRKSPTR